MEKRLIEVIAQKIERLESEEKSYSQTIAELEEKLKYSKNRENDAELMECKQDLKKITIELDATKIEQEELNYTIKNKETLEIEIEKLTKEYEKLAKEKEELEEEINSGGIGRYEVKRELLKRELTNIENQYNEVSDKLTKHKKMKDIEVESIYALGKKYNIKDVENEEILKEETEKEETKDQNDERTSKAKTNTEEPVNPNPTVDNSNQEKKLFNEVNTNLNRNLSRNANIKGAIKNISIGEKIVITYNDEEKEDTVLDFKAVKRSLNMSVTQKQEIINELLDTRNNSGIDAYRVDKIDSNILTALKAAKDKGNISAEEIKEIYGNYEMAILKDNKEAKESTKALFTYDKTDIEHFKLKNIFKMFTRRETYDSLLFRANFAGHSGIAKVKQDEKGFFGRIFSKKLASENPIRDEENTVEKCKSEEWSLKPEVKDKINKMQITVAKREATPKVQKASEVKKTKDNGMEL